MADLRTDDRAAASPDDEESPVELAVEAVETVVGERHRLWRREYTVLLLVAFVLAGFAYAVYVLDADPSHLRRYGYLGVFLIPLIGSASFILPMPGLAVIATGGAFLDPVLGLPPWIVVGVVAGLGEALGELTGYAIGVSGRDLIAKGKWYEKANHWMVTYGFWCVAFFAFIPNPFFDAIGFAAGVLRYPLWKFVLACMIGKSLKFWMAAESHRVVELSCTWFPIACNTIRSLGALSLFD